MSGVREIAFDTETTGFDAWGEDRLTEIGCVELIDFLPTGQKFHTLVHPEGKEISARVTEITGHTNESLRNAPKFKDIAQDFRDFVGDSAMIAHNANFDRGFINAAMDREDYELYPPKRFIDTLVLAREKFPGASNTLDALCKRFDISLATRAVHGALVDAELLAKVYLELKGGRARSFGFGEQGDKNMGEVVKAAIRARPTPLGPLSTEDERAAHAKFVEENLGDKAIWNRYS
ncbi:MAG TPA: DNA polymerase III subunit epsilon [Hellea balneolensis]|uniref:DNA polymerase III subunit epsilon n=1 Tax=Hellea balneolensis TaxID=287478 RepID=A0A7C5LTY1_9PROT|nr:DNA polymerase III subunit epsilon [Hellea balneolensis]